MIDFHCHLDLYPNPLAVRDECITRGLYVLSITTTPSAWKGTSALAEKSQWIQTGLGLHPQIAHERKSELVLFDELLPGTPYVGEIGLDGGPEYRRYWNDQTMVFDHVLNVCREAGGRVMSIHSRHASKAVIDRLEGCPDAGTPVLHWFSGSLRDLDRAVGLGCWFSVGPAMLRTRKGRDLTAKMPRERVLTESDGPFATAHGRSLWPWEVSDAVSQLAEIWSASQEDVEKTVWKNLQTLLRDEKGVFKIPNEE
ncbi:Qat anti-phage system TatD family nuclease QatD [Candidatus Nitrospira nitrificans]|uniref:Uncharacterized protein n=1 Tax=Candidatus Nitrospira nitrificans TaxID=1742973 RepID=A0A0S4LJS0_9BACT|nr:Qat anti-phage system TatD family nuclease QatD [Candidatus Nitrospira nitrificans]CUS37831.1 conserved hypothetical protein [Candidatus Nitrospira nitrificans]